MLKDLLNNVVTQGHIPFVVKRQNAPMNEIIQSQACLVLSAYQMQ